MLDDEITWLQVMDWIETETVEQIAEMLLDIINGKYTPEQMREDVLKSS